MAKNTTKNDQESEEPVKRESIQPQSLVLEMQTSYLDYAMSVIFG